MEISDEVKSYLFDTVDTVRVFHVLGLETIIWFQALAMIEVNCVFNKSMYSLTVSKSQNARELFLPWVYLPLGKWAIWIMLGLSVQDYWLWIFGSLKSGNVYLNIDFWRFGVRKWASPARIMPAQILKGKNHHRDKRIEARMRKLSCSTGLCLFSFLAGLHNAFLGGRLLQMLWRIPCMRFEKNL